MKFSVLISVYARDTKEYFELALNSIINQTLQPNEIVVIVDGIVHQEVTDLINYYKATWPSLITVFQLEENVGLGEALKLGVKKCKYDVIARMDADDISKIDRFEKQIKFLMDHPNVDIVGAYISEFILDPSQIVSERKVPINNFEIKKYAKRRSPFNHMTVMFRKDAILRAGNYEKFPFLEDYYMWIRLIGNNANACNIPESLVHVRIGIGNEMFKRRGGKNYLQSEIKLQNYMFKRKFINVFELFTNIFVRSFFRLSPNNVRAKLYKSYLRD